MAAPGNRVSRAGDAKVIIVVIITVEAEREGERREVVDLLVHYCVLVCKYVCETCAVCLCIDR